MASVGIRKRVSARTGRVTYQVWWLLDDGSQGAETVGSKEEAKAMTARAIAEMGGLDALVNNAGTPATRRPIPPSDLDALSEQFWTRILSVNLLSAFWVTKSAAAALREARGSVVNTVSISAFRGGGRPAPLNRLIELIEQAVGKKARRRALPAQPGDVPRTHASPALIRALTGFEAKTPLEERVPAFVDWYGSYSS